MSGDGDGERPRRSWSEIDRLRDRPRARGDARDRRPADTAHARSATQQYLKQLDQRLFARGGRGGAEAERLAAAVREALGSERLADACRAYLAALGPPADPALLGAFLDARDREVQLAALGAIADGLAARRLSVGAGLRAQLRILAEGLDDELAEAAEAALSAG